MGIRKKVAVFVLGILFVPVAVLAAVNDLNGQTGSTQTFVDDTNVTISSTADTHTLGWNGVLGVDRGGTGIGTTFTEGSIIFSGATGAYTENNGNLFWDDTSHRLGIGTAAPGRTLDVNGDLRFYGSLEVGNNPYADRSVIEMAGQDILNIEGGDSIGEFGTGVNILVHAGEGLAESDDKGGDVTILGGDGDLSLGQGGNVKLQGGEGSAKGVILLASHTDVLGGHDLRMRMTGAGQPGNIAFMDDYSTTLGQLSYEATYGSFVMSSDAGSISIESASGNVGVNVLDPSVTLNVEDGEDPTVQIGNDGLNGCLILGDSDGSGVTYITADDGVLSATDTKPAACQ